MHTGFDTPSWVLWGVLPVAAAILGYFIPAICLEGLLRTSWAQERFLRRPSGGRQDAIQKVHEEVATTWKQVRVACWVLFGPTGLLNGMIGAICLPVICGEHNPAWPSIHVILIHLCLMQLVGDFFLYWGHRVQHEVPFLWKHCHSFHHKVHTPTPFSAVYIDPTDATLQAGLPILLSAAVVRPHPYTFAVYSFLRVAENVVNHCGLESGFVNAVTLKWLPGRASISHHDGHHLYSNRAAGAKNFAENFWIWDWAFGTLSTFKAA